MEWIEKKMSLEAAVETAAAARSVGLPVQAYFIVGYPVETMDDYIGTLGLLSRLAKLDVDEVVASGYTLLPGSPHFDLLQSRGEIDLSEDFFASLFQGSLSLRESCSPYFNGSEIQALRLYALLWFYAQSLVRRPGRIFRVLKGIFTKNGKTMLDRVVAKDATKILRSFKPLLSRASLSVLRSILRRAFCKKLAPGAGPFNPFEQP